MLFGFGHGITRGLFALRQFNGVQVQVGIVFCQVFPLFFNISRGIRNSITMMSGNKCDTKGIY